MNVKKTAVLLIAAVLLVTAFAGAASAVADAQAGNDEYVAKIGGTYYTSLEAACEAANPGDEIQLLKDCYLNDPLTIRKVTINGAKSDGNKEDRYTITSNVDGTGKHLFEIRTKTFDEDWTVLKNVIINFNGKPGDIIIRTTLKTSDPDTRKMVNLENVKLTGMSTSFSLLTGQHPRSALHIEGVKVNATDLEITIPDNPTLIERFVGAINMQSVENRFASELTINTPSLSLAYCYGEPKAKIYKLESGVSKEEQPVAIEDLFGQTLYVWLGFDVPVEVASWNELATAVQSADLGTVINLTAWINSEGSTKEINIPAGVRINSYGEGSDHYSIKLNEGYSIVVNDVLGLGDVLGSTYAVAYGPGLVKTGSDFLNLPILDEYLFIPPGLTIQVDEFGEGPKNKVTIDLPAGKTLVLIADMGGNVKVKENKHIVVNGPGSVKLLDDPREDESNAIKKALKVDGILDLYAKIEQWPSNGVEGTGTVNIYNKDSAIPNGNFKINILPFAEISGQGQIIDETGEPVDVDSDLHVVGSKWSITNNVLKIADKTYILEPADGYTGYWDVSASAGTVDKAGMFKAVFVKNVNRGHSASIPKDYTPSSSVPVMVQETVKPTTAPTLAAPTAMPTTAKPTTQQTQKSPAPFLGLIAGLGAAALVLARMRR